MYKISKIVSTFFGSGYFPIASGTFGVIADDIIAGICTLSIMLCLVNLIHYLN